jgi:hypothetical protein
VGRHTVSQRVVPQERSEENALNVLTVDLQTFAVTERRADRSPAFIRSVLVEDIAPPVDPYAVFRSAGARDDQRATVGAASTAPGFPVAAPGPARPNDRQPAQGSAPWGPRRDRRRHAAPKTKRTLTATRLHSSLVSMAVFGTACLGLAALLGVVFA